MSAQEGESGGRGGCAVGGVQVELVLVTQARLVVIGCELGGDLHPGRAQRVRKRLALRGERIGVSAGQERGREASLVISPG